jgi:ABC-2 type transport system permease protein
MNETTTTDFPVLDATDTALEPIPMSRLVEVELRKLVDTRAGRWLGIIQAVLIVAASAIVVTVVAFRDEQIELMDFVGIAGSVMAILLPVMGILAITTEWSQRTNLATFTLEPRRGRVIAAKSAAAASAALVSIGIAVAVGLAATTIASLVGVGVDWHFDVDILFGFALAQVLGTLMGFALGALLLSTPAAIVAFFTYYAVLPSLFALGADQLSWFEGIQPWIDFAGAQTPLGVDGITQVDLPNLAVAGTIWLGLPLVAGIRRIQRSEIK